MNIVAARSHHRTRGAADPAANRAALGRDDQRRAAAAFFTSGSPAHRASASGAAWWCGVPGVAGGTRTVAPERAELAAVRVDELHEVHGPCTGLDGTGAAECSGT
jgi:hypothetical protein